VPALALFALARLFGAHWNAWMLYGMVAAAFGLLLRAVAAWRGWLAPSPLSRQGRGVDRAHTAVRVPVWLVGAAAIWVAVLPVQLGDELSSVRTAVAVVALLGVTGAVFPVRHRSWVATAGMGAAGATLAYDLVTGLAAPPEPTVSLASPFLSTATVFHGGGSPLLNHHAALQSQAHAQDLVLAPDGSEVVGDPSQQEGWACFHAPVLAPAAGKVVVARDDRPDMPIGEMDLEAIVGNHVVLELAPDRYVLLAHLEQGSVEVSEGQRVAAGERLARCGNSGNTSQPHLHIQVQNQPGFSNDDPGLHTFPIRWAKRRRGGEVVADAPARRNDELLPSF